MNSLHAKPCCCRAKVYRFGSRRRQCSRCKANLEHPHKETGPKTLAKCSWIVGSRFGARAIVEDSGAAHWPDAASNGTPLASGHAAVCIPSSGFAFAKRTVGFDLGRAVFSISRKRLGFVYDGA